LKKRNLLIFFSLAFSLFIYLFYRTEKTVINELFIYIISYEKFDQLRSIIVNALPLSNLVIYSLPEGLWVFCITLTSKFLFVKIGRLEIKLLFIPLVFSISLEVFQLLHVTKGTFDYWDIVFSILFWALANYVINYTKPIRNIIKPFDINSLICLFSYLIVYLAHVWN